MVKKKVALKKFRVGYYVSDDKCNTIYLIVNNKEYMAYWNNLKTNRRLYNRFEKSSLPKNHYALKKVYQNPNGKNDAWEIGEIPNENMRDMHTYAIAKVIALLV